MHVSTKNAAESARETALELTYTVHALAPLARDVGYVDASGEVMPLFI